MRADIVAKALDSVPRDGRPALCLSPRGAPLTQERARALSMGPGALLIAGRFEGIDQRLIEARKIEEISIGDFVLAGGEIAAMALIEACVRLIPGVLGSPSSAAEESFEAGLLEYPHYTRPREFEGLEIPAVLLSGDHKKIAAWRRQKAEEITRTRRPDLWKRYFENGPIRRDKNKD
jgi:tRNA (guanine37-N1)-methyltransferase